jgi:predicted metal-binding membrane protein
MLIMFVVGVMNVLWMVIIAGFVLVEKLVPGGRSISYISGLLLVVWGAWMLAPALL